MTAPIEEPFVIAELGGDDVETLVELFETVVGGFVAVVGDDRHGVARFLSDPATFALAAHVGTRPAGLAWGVHIPYPNGRSMTYLHQLDVLERDRRRGIGRALVRTAMALAARRGSAKFWLSTGGHNEVAQSLYAGLAGERKPLGDVNYWWTLSPVPPGSDPPPAVG